VFAPAAITAEGGVLVSAAERSSSTDVVPLRAFAAAALAPPVADKPVARDRLVDAGDPIGLGRASLALRPWRFDELSRSPKAERRRDVKLVVIDVSAPDLPLTPGGMGVGVSGGRGETEVVVLPLLLESWRDMEVNCRAADVPFSESEMKTLPLLFETFALVDAFDDRPF